MVKALVSLLLLFCILYLCSGFYQNKYHITHDKIIIESYNRSVVRNPSVVVEDFNSTCKKSTFRCYAEFIQGVKKNILISVIIYKMVGTVYRNFPIPRDTFFDLCNEIKNKRKEFLVVLNHSNLHGCPAPPGKYVLNDYVLEEEKFPPHAPLGKYKLYLEVYVDDVIFLGNGTWEGALVKNKP